MTLPEDLEVRYNQLRRYSRELVDATRGYMKKQTAEKALELGECLARMQMHLDETRPDLPSS